jgi:hypothetical protein
MPIAVLGSEFPWAVIFSKDHAGLFLQELTPEQACHSYCHRVTAHLELLCQLVNKACVVNVHDIITQPQGGNLRA